jgi:hypothetical protein
MAPAQAETKNRRRKFKKTIKALPARLTLKILVFRRWLQIRANRRTFANVLMLCFIIFTSIGAGMIFFPAGWVVAGVSCGLFGFLLGSE